MEMCHLYTTTYKLTSSTTPGFIYRIDSSCNVSQLKYKDGRRPLFLSDILCMLHLVFTLFR